MSKRLGKLQSLMQKKGVETLLIEDPVDLFYLTGIHLSLGRLLVENNGASLFVDGRYIEMAKKRAPCEVFSVEEFEGKLKGVKEVGFDSSFLTFDRFETYKKLLPHIEWTPMTKPTQELRVIKDPGEIASLKKAADLTWDGYLHLVSLLKEGVREKDLALEFEFFCKKRGANSLSFDPIIAFGENSAYPHYRAGEAKLKQDQIIQFDLGVSVEYYSGDLSRVHFFGKGDPQLEKMYEWVQRAQSKALDAIRPGVKIGTLDKIAREEFIREGVEAQFVHGLGHGIGLETHEYPRIKTGGLDANLILEPGMVFTVEPGLYQPGLGGVRYEDTVLVTESGVENFFARTS